MARDISGILSEYDSPLIVGPYPPPLGGVSVHIYRLAKRLPAATVFDTSTGGGIKYFRLLSLLLNKNNHIDVVHLHILTLKAFSVIFFARIFRPFDVITTDHNPRLFVNGGYLKNGLLKYFLSRITIKVVVGHQIKENYITQKVVRATDTVVNNSFIPPPLDEEAEIRDSYPAEYKTFITLHHPVLTTSAYQIVFLDGVDLYGFDMCIDLLHKLKSFYPKSGMVIFLADKSKCGDYLISLKKKIADYSLQNHVIFITGQRELWPVYLDVDLMLRPTYSDGFGVSIAEAIHLGCPALASDVCERAEGTELFSSRNQDDFLLRARSILSRKLNSKDSVDDA